MKRMQLSYNVIFGRDSFVSLSLKTQHLQQLCGEHKWLWLVWTDIQVFSFFVLHRAVRLWTVFPLGWQVRRPPGCSRMPFTRWLHSQPYFMPYFIYMERGCVYEVVLATTGSKGMPPPLFAYCYPTKSGMAGCEIFTSLNLARGNPSIVPHSKDYPGNMRSCPSHELKGISFLLARVAPHRSGTLLGCWPYSFRVNWPSVYKYWLWLVQRRIRRIKISNIFVSVSELANCTNLNEKKPRPFSRLQTW